jgi:hypothetical protein
VHHLYCAQPLRLLICNERAATIEYRVPGQSEPVTNQFSLAEFDRFAKEHVVLHKQVHEDEDSERVRIMITDLHEAIRALKVEGTYLFVQGDSYGEESSWVDSDDDVMEDGTSIDYNEQSNKAIAVNPDLLSKYNDKLELLHDGNSVEFIDITTGATVLTCDGLIKNSTVVLVSKVLTHLDGNCVSEVANVTIPALADIIRNTSQFRSDPDGILQELSGLGLVPIVSCETYSEKAMQACLDKNVHLLQVDRSGMSSLLHDTARI